MWSLYISVGVFLLFVGILILTLPSQRTKQIAVSYRFRYLKLIDNLEYLTDRANKLYVMFEKNQRPQLSDEVLRNFRMLETLMETTRKIPPFGFEITSLAAADFLALDIRTKFAELEKQLQGNLFVKWVPKSWLRNHQKVAAKAAYVGCYFCSRPFDPTLFSNVRVKLETATRSVTSCQWCKEVLTKTKKARVLYFLKDGNPVHWSEWEEFVPGPSFWNINVDEIKTSNAQKLQLVYSDRDS
jgi:hypothetical protein